MSPIWILSPGILTTCGPQCKHLVAQRYKECLVHPRDSHYNLGEKKINLQFCVPCSGRNTVYIACIYIIIICMCVIVYMCVCDYIYMFHYYVCLYMIVYICVYICDCVHICVCFCVYIYIYPIMGQMRVEKKPRKPFDRGNSGAES